MKKILLINPPRVDGRPVVREERFEHKDFEVIYPPLTLLYCASQIRKHLKNVEVFFIDAMGYDLDLLHIKKRFDDINPDIVITRFAFDTYKEDLFLLDEIKKWNPKVITITRNKIVGDVPSLMESYLRKFKGIDYFVTVEQDSVIHKVINDIINGKSPESCAFIKNGELIVTKKSEEINDLDEIPFPAYDLLTKENWPYKSSLFPKKFTLVMTSRGCPNQCTFCAYRNKKWRYRSPKNVVEELKQLDRMGIKNFVYFDDTISINKDRCIEICRLMKKEGLAGMKYAICTRVNNIDEELLMAWVETGLEEISFGVESGSETILKKCGKGITKQQIMNAFDLCKKFKIKALTLIILGLPGETHDTIKESRELIKKIKPFYLQYSFCIPFPNTPVYEYYKSNGFLLHEDYSKYNPLTMDPVIKTEKLSYEELIKEKEKSYAEFILNPGFIFRNISLTDWKWNLRGLKMFINRVYSMVLNKYIR